MPKIIVIRERIYTGNENDQLVSVHGDILLLAFNDPALRAGKVHTVGGDERASWAMECRARSTDAHNCKSLKGEIQFVLNPVNRFAIWFIILLRDHGCNPLVDHCCGGALAT